VALCRIGLRPDSQRAGHQSGPSRSPTWASFGPGRRRALSAVGSDPTAGRDPRGIKTGDAGLSRNPSDSFSLSLLSPRDTAATATGHGGRAEWAGWRRRGLRAGRGRSHALEPRTRDPGVPERRASGSTVPRSPASGGKSASHAPTTAVARGPGRSRAL